MTSFVSIVSSLKDQLPHQRPARPTPARRKRQTSCRQVSETKETFLPVSEKRAKQRCARLTESLLSTPPSEFRPCRPLLRDLQYPVVSGRSPGKSWRSSKHSSSSGNSTVRPGPSPV